MTSPTVPSRPRNAIQYRLIADVTADELRRMILLGELAIGEERLEAATRHAHDVAPRPSIAQRFGGTLRRIAYRAQLGPVAGPAAI